MPSIFLCYRREDASGHVGRLHDRLVPAFGKDNVFMDISTLAPGVDFDTEIRNRLSKIDVMLVVMGRHWLDSRDPAGNRRIDNPDDYVRLEIAIALKGQIRVIPVLVGLGAMPTSDVLPEEIRSLGRRHAMELTDSRWDYDTGTLIDALRTITPSPDVQHPPAAPPKPSHAPVRDSKIDAAVEAPLDFVVRPRKTSVFVAHAPADTDRAVSLQRVLETAGFRVWKSTLDWRGDQMTPHSEMALASSSLAVLCCSKSTEKTLPLEFSAALNARSKRPAREMPVVVVKVEPCDLPGTLRELTSVDLFAEDGAKVVLQAIRVGLAI